MISSKKKMLGFKVRRQYGINNFVIDFYCPELKLGIEVDGDIHFEYGRRFQDQKKDELLKNFGIRIIRISTLNMEADYKSIVIYLEDYFKKRAEEMFE